MPYKILTSNGLRQLVFLLGLIMLFGFYSVHLGQDVGFDTRNYHFYNAYAFIYHRLGWDIAPASIQTYLNPFFDVFNYFLITTLTPRTVAFLEGAISGISAFFLFKTALILFSETKPRLQLLYATAATLLGMTGWAGLCQLGSMGNDTKATLFTIAVLYYTLKAIAFTHNKQRCYIFISIAGLLIGLATGFKLYTAYYALGLFFGLMLYQQPFHKNISLAGLYTLSIIIGFIIANGYWMWLLYQHFANPFFPLYNNIFHSPYADFSNSSSSGYHPNTFLQYIFLPFYMVKENNILPTLHMHDPRFAVTFILGLLTLIITFYKKQSNTLISPAWRLVLTTFFFSYVIWLIEFTITRFTMPLEIQSGLLIVYFSKIIFTKIRAQIIALVIISLAIILNTSSNDSGVHQKITEQYFAMNIPPLPKASLVLIASNSPVSYIIPFFPADTRFISIYNAFTSSTTPNLMKKNIAQIIENYKGPVFTITEQHDKKGILKRLDFYHLASKQINCQVINTNTNDKYYLCPATRI